MVSNEDFELDDLGMANPAVAKQPLKVASRRGRIYHRFIYGPINLAWMCKAFELGSAAAFVGMALWYFSGLNKRRLTFRAGVIDLSLGTVSPSTVKRGRAALESAGLIRVGRGKGKKNLIEIVDVLPSEVSSLSSAESANQSGIQSEPLSEGL